MSLGTPSPRATLPGFAGWGGACEAWGRATSKSRFRAGDRPRCGPNGSGAHLGAGCKFDRERTGRGSKVSTSLLASGVWANACDLQAKICNATFPDRAIGTNPVNPLIHGYRSRDGKVFLLVQLDPECEFPRLCAGLGAAELATNPLFATVESRTRHAAELFAILQSMTRLPDY